MQQTYDIVIVGAGHAGAQVAIALRQNRFVGSIAMLGDEPDPPYERPPLSKDYLAGDKPFERLLIRPAAFWANKGIDMLPGCRVVAVDPAAKVLTCADESKIGYGTLVWATGGAPRRLVCSGHDLIGVHGVRTRADVDRMIAELPGVTRVVVIGGGYIGLEAAAVLTKLGKRVTVLEALPRVLARVAGEPLSRFYESEHRAHGVEIRLNAVVACIEQRDGRACGVRMANDEVLECEMVIVGIGIVPAVEPLLAAGATGSNGVDVDALCRTSLNDVYAIGDCAAHDNRFAGGEHIRLESVQNANDQAIVVAKAIIGIRSPYDAVPWFWSNQYDLRLQTVGLSAGYDATVVRGNINDKSFSIVYLKHGQVIALDCVNATKDYVQGRALVAAGSAVSADQLANTMTRLKDVARLAPAISARLAE